MTFLPIIVFSLVTVPMIVCAFAVITKDVTALTKLLWIVLAFFFLLTFIVGD